MVTKAILDQGFDPAILDADEVATSIWQAGLRPSSCAALERVRAWPSGESGMVVLYTDSGAGWREGWWAIHATGGRIRKVHREALGSGRAFMLKGIDAIAHRLADDPQLPGLPSLLDPATAMQTLKPWLAQGPWEQLEARVVSYKPMRRCVIQFQDGGDRSEPTMFAKVLRVGHAEAVWRNYSELDRTLTAEPLHETMCALPFALAGPHSAILWREQPGTSVRALLETPDAFEAVNHAGDLLGALHRSNTGWTQVHGPDREVATTARWAAAVGVAWPKVQRELDLEIAGLEMAGTSKPGSALVASHRDFYDKQVLVDGTLAVFIDLDTASLAEPELDLANFVAHLELRCLQGHTRNADYLAQGFLDAYASRHKRPDPGRFSFYKASSLLRLACVYALRANDWSQLSASLLSQAQSCRTVNETLGGV